MEEKFVPEPTVNPHDVAARWKNMGFSFGVFTDPPGQVWENFVHDTDELLMAIKGEMELSMQGKTIRCQIGQEIFIPAKVMHTVRNVGKTGSQWLYGYKGRPIA
jgi:mannose-6-phosphate isomerase-like protein (cupin superfamily)